MSGIRTEAQPTEEQINELWEWCGLRQSGRRFWYDAEDNMLLSAPRPDLTNLFKWAVPKTIEVLRDRYMSSGKDALFKLFDLWLKEYWQPRSEPISIGEALFWAIWKVIGKED